MSGGMTGGASVRYAVRHRTIFRYRHPVRFARCNLRLQPVEWDGQLLEDFTLDITPPASISATRPGEGLVNVTRIQIERSAYELMIESKATVSVARACPQILADDPSIATVAAAALVTKDIGPLSPASYFYPSRRLSLCPEIADWCAKELAPDRSVVDAGLALAKTIQREFRYDGNATVTDTSPLTAFHARGGVCQDFAQIMIIGCRAAGLPAAYVSGYLRTIPPPGQPRLVGADATHAWVLIWCGPTRGWIGFDPTNGCLMASDHIITAIGRDYADIAPVDGIFFGQNGQQIEVEVDVEPIGWSDVSPP